jgi:putative membrane protein
VNERPRKPAAFRLDDPQVVLSLASDAPRAEGPSGKIVVSPAPAVEDMPPTFNVPALRRRRFPWGTLFWSTFGSLVVLALGVALTQFIADLFSRAQWLGVLGSTLAVLSVLALVVIVAREVIGLARLAKSEHLRERALAVIESDDRIEGRGLVHDLLAHTRGLPRLARARARLESHLNDIIDGADFVRLAERELMAPLDAEARNLVGAAARRVSVVTTVSPRAMIDVAFVFVTVLGLTRMLATLYGGRPGTLGLLRLSRLVLSHATVTGGLALGDSLIQQLVGHGVAAKLSARLGEGMLNGLLTARLGLAAIEVIRPLPFVALTQPSLNEIAGSLLRSREEAKPEG